MKMQGESRLDRHLRIAMVGTRGVPARYGGFETCVEEVGRRLVDRGHEVVVYCRSSGASPIEERLSHYQGMELVHLPAVRRRSLETLSHTGLSAAHLVRHRTDAAFVFNAANAPFLPLLRAARIPTAMHVDGLEWQRAKWNGLGQRYYRLVERLSVWWADALIADAPGIAAHYRDTFDAETVQIAYGAPVVEPSTDRLTELGLERDGYHLVVARFEPENHVRLAVEGYVRSRAELPLVVVGSAPYSSRYTERVRAVADDRVRLLGGVWDQGLLDQLYVGARSYLHGHSVGGTNPSLLRALGAGAPVIAFDVSFNRDVAQDAGCYFSTEDDVARCVEQAESDDGVQGRGEASLARAAAYDWEDVTNRYEALGRRLASGATSLPAGSPAPVA